MTRTVRAARYVVPFREGGSVPALVEGDDLGLWVVKLRGAAQGARALVAELLAGELARAAGLRVPEIARVEVDRELAASEPDPELAEPLEASAGLNVGLDYLPGSVTFDPAVGPRPSADEASLVVLFDAFVANVDRTARNPNLLVWHGGLWLIDHGAALWFHHGWSPDRPLDGVADPFAEVRDHVLLRHASALPAAARALEAALARVDLRALTEELPDAWLDGDDLARSGFESPAAQRAAYVRWLEARRATIPALTEEAERARALLVPLRRGARGPARRA